MENFKVHNGLITVIIGQFNSFKTQTSTLKLGLKAAAEVMASRSRISFSCFPVSVGFYFTFV